MSKPIDPTDVDGVARLRGAYLVALKNGLGEWQAWEIVAARAKEICLPEGYVAVPIELVRDALRLADHRSSEKSVHQHMNTLRSLIAESEAADG